MPSLRLFQQKTAHFRFRPTYIVYRILDQLVHITGACSPLCLLGAQIHIGYSLFLSLRFPISLPWMSRPIRLSTDPIWFLYMNFNTFSTNVESFGTLLGRVRSFVYSYSVMNFELKLPFFGFGVDSLFLLLLFGSIFGAASSICERKIRKWQKLRKREICLIFFLIFSIFLIFPKKKLNCVDLELIGKDFLSTCTHETWIV